jgi:predicted nicotinamide N-methyase
MKYPLALTNINDNLSIYVPDASLVKLHYEKLLEVDANTPFPFWAKLWPSAIAMAQFLKDEPGWIQNKKVIEIGAGIGLPSLGIASIAREIIVSDYSQEAVELAQKNINYLLLENASAINLDWHNMPNTILADTILLSDINYDPTDFDSLLKLINRFLNNKCTIIIATPQRIMASKFVQELQPLIKESSIVTIDYQNELVAISLLILYA